MPQKEIQYISLYSKMEDKGKKGGGSYKLSLEETSFMDRDRKCRSLVTLKDNQFNIIYRKLTSEVSVFFSFL